MLGFVNAREVNHDAAVLKRLADIVINKYACLDSKQLSDIISHNFDESHRSIGISDVNFFFQELPEFLFSFNVGRKRSSDSSGLLVYGRGKYEGFLLMVIDKETLYCSVSNGIVYRATSRAKKLAKILSSKYDIPDTTKLQNSIRRGRL